MTYDGTTTTISGMPILFLSVTGAPLNNGTYFIDGPITCTFSPTGTCGTLNTQTGALSGTSGNTVNFGPGGSLSLSGSVDLLNGTEVVPFGPIVDSGSYTTASLNTSSLTLSTSGVGFDFKDPAFLAYFGITNTAFQFSFSANALAPTRYTPPGTFTDAPIQLGGLTNVPEPSAFLVWASGFLVAGGVLRRKVLR